MPSTSSAPTSADRMNHAGISIGCRPLEPDDQFHQDLQRQDLQSRNLQSAFELQLSRHHELLYFIASRILTCPQEAEEAVKNCLHTASQNPPECGSEGAFKSWLVRILIDEATLLLRNKQSDPVASSNHLPALRSEAH